MQNSLTIRRNSELKCLIYLIVLILGLLFIAFLVIKYPELQGAYISVSICLAILSIFLIATWLPKVWIQIEGDSVLIFEGVAKGSEVAKVKLESIKKVRFKTYKEASGTSSGMGN